jgi:hypothetical protein
VSPIGGEGCAAHRHGRSTWRVTESVEWLARASRAGDQQSEGPVEMDIPTQTLLKSVRQSIHSSGLLEQKILKLLV